MSFSGEASAPRPSGPGGSASAEGVDHNRSTVSEDADGGPTRLEPTEPYEPPVPPAPTYDATLEYLRLGPPGRPGSLGRLEHYEIFNVVGRGAMGVVLRAFDTQLGRTVAIKLMSLQLMLNHQARSRFFREARAAAGINHPNVVTIHAVAEHASIPYLVMEYVGGRSLMDRIRTEAPLDPADVLRISSQVASGLAAAHQQGVIHRDIKPANIMLEDSIERVKITDFGLARVIMDTSELTSQGGVVGTPAYMSPEQVNGQPLDPRSDLFSLGCVMYAMIAGHSPFRGEHALGTARRVAGHKHVSLSEISRDVPAYFIQVVDRLLEKNPDDRYQTAAEVVAELTGYLAKLNRGGVPEVVKPKPKPTPPPAPRRGARWLALAVLTMAACATFWVAFGRDMRWWRGPDRKGTPIASSERRILRVAQHGGADYASLAAALRHATPGSTIRVEDAAVYEESVALFDSDKLADVRLEAPEGATLAGPTERPVLAINGVRGVSISGFRIEAALGQHAIDLSGACAGVVIENCRVVTPPKSPLAAIVLHGGASGDSKAPIILRRLSVRCGGVGVVFGETTDPGPIRHAELAESVIRAAGREYGVPLVLQARAEHVAIHHNVFCSGHMGISVAFDAPGRAADVVIAQNSLGDLECAFIFNESSADEGIRIDRNLIVGSEAVFSGAREVEPFASWFHDNWWERAPGLNEALAGRFAEPKDPLSFVSRDPESADYLKPAGELPAPAPGRYSRPAK